MEYKGVIFDLVSKSTLYDAGLNLSNLLSNWKFEVITGLSTEAYKKPNPLVALQILICIPLIMPECML